ncbi:MAG: PAS domain S-box protein [Verrucomicrobia bacterium]|nr:PAS domain S-box protein [Verrucomicrobiota bacterium]
MNLGRRLIKFASLRVSLLLPLASLLLLILLIQAMLWRQHSTSHVNEQYKANAVDLASTVRVALETLPEKDWQRFVSALGARRTIRYVWVTLGSPPQLQISSDLHQSTQTLERVFKPELVAKLTELSQGDLAGLDWVEGDTRHFMVPIRVISQQGLDARPLQGVVYVVVDAREVQLGLPTSGVVLGVGAAISMLILIGGGIWVLQVVLFRRLDEMRSVLLRWSVGDTEPRIAAQSLDELGDIGRTLNNTMDALQKAKNRLDLALEATHDGLFDIDLQSGQTYFSPRVATLLKCPPEMLPLSLNDLLDRFCHPDHLEVKEEFLRRVAIPEANLAELDLAIRRQDGQKGWWQFRGQGVVRQPNGTAQRRLGLITEITELKNAQIALQENSKRLELALRAANQGLYDIDLRTGGVVVNRQYAEMLGFDPETFQETHAAWRKRLHPEDAPQVLQQFDDYFSGKSPEYRVEFRSRVQGAGWKWILSLGAIVERDRQGRPLRFLGTHTDISRRKQLELRERVRVTLLERLLAGESLANLLESIIRHFETVCPDSIGSILLVDPRTQCLRHGAALGLPEFYCRAIDGLAPGPAVGSCGTAAFLKQRVIVEDIEGHPAWKEFRDLARQAKVRSCWSEPIRGPGDSVLGTFAFYHATVASPTPEDLLEMEFAAQIARIIIEHHSISRQLRESEERYVLAERAVQDGIWDWNLTTNEAYLSPQWKALVGYSDHELANVVASFFGLTHPDDRSEVEAAIERHLKQGEPFRQEFRLRHKDGYYRWILSRGEAVRLNGQAVRMVGAITDVTEQRENAEKLRASEAFARGTLNALSAHIAVLDETGKILATNRAWQEFGVANEGELERLGPGVNYLEVCEHTVDAGASMAHTAAAGILSVIKRERNTFSFEYPCHSTHERRWFVCRVTRFEGEHPVRVAVAHENITETKLAQLESIRLNQKFHDLFEFSPDAKILASNERGIELVNHSAKVLFEWDSEEIVGRPLESVIPGFCDFPRLEGENIEPSLGEPWTTEGIRSGGARFPCEVSISRIDSEGARQISVSIRDISQRVIREDALRQSENRFRTVVERAPEPILISTDHCFAYANPAAVKMFGADSAEQLLRTPIMERVHPQSRDLVARRMAQVYDESRPAGSQELQMIRLDGTVVDVETVGVPFEFEGKVGALVFVRDCTLRRQAEVALRQNDELFQSLFQSGVLGVMLANVEGTITRANDSFLRMFGYTAADLPLRWDTLTPPEWRAGDVGALEKVLRGEELEPYEKEYFHRDGRRIPILIGATQLRAQPGVMICFVLDRTEQKRAAGELERHRLELAKRVQELQVISRLGALLETSDRLLPQLLQEAVEIVPAGMQNPEKAYSTLKLRGDRFDSRANLPTEAGISVPIILAGRVEGELRVGYEDQDQSILPQEVEWVRTLVRLIGDKLDARESRQAMIQSETRFRVIFEGSPEGIVAADPHGKVVLFNQSVIRMFGYTDVEFAQLNVESLHPPESIPEMREKFQRMLAGDRRPSGAFPCVRRDGSRFYCNVNPALVEVDGRSLILGFFNDVTEQYQIRLELEKSENELIKAQSIAHLGSFSYDVASGAMSASKETLRIYEFPPGTPTLADVRPLVHPEDLPRVMQDFERSLQGAPYELEYRLVFAGRTKWVSVRAEPVRNEGGAVVALAGVVQDITEAKLSEMALERERVLLRTVLRTIPDPIWLKNGDGAYLLCNSRYEQLVGKKEAEIVGKTDEAFFDARLAESYRVDDVRVVQSRVPTVREDRVRFVFDGHEELAEIIRVPAQDRSGKLLGVLGIARDITSQRKAQETLRKYNADLEERVKIRTMQLAARTREFETVVLSIPDSVLRIRPNGAVVFSQFSPDAAGTNPEHLHMAAGLQGHLSELVEEALKVGQGVGPERRVSIAEKELAGGVVELRVSPLAEGDFLVLVRDISARRRLDEEIRQALKHERQLSEMKSRFISVASHEFRTPMAAVAGSAELLQHHQDRLTPAKRGELLERIRAGVSRLNSIVDDVLTLSRVDAGRVEVRPMPLDLDRTFREILAEAEVADRGGHTFQFQSRGELGGMAADPKILHHIVSNLLSNAARYSPPGTSIVLTLTGDRTGFGFTVEDEGIGVPEEDRPHLFEPFYRGSNVGSVSGTGLGLNIVKRFTELHGGIIELMPREKGTCFHCWFPARS